MVTTYDKVEAALGVPANKMPEMPEAAATVTVDAVVVFDLGGPRHVWCQTIELAAQNEMAPGAKVYTADQMRAMYLAGIADAREKFASEWPNGEFRLWDSQWVNCVNHDHAYENSDKEDAVAQAVKLAEKYMGKNVELALTNLTALEQGAKK